MTEVHIIFDIFPAKIRYPLTGTREPVRAIVADGVLTVWRDSNAGPVVDFTRPVVSYEGNSATGFVVQVEDGLVAVTRSSRCGCGSQLRRYDPYGGATQIQMAV